MILKEGTKFSVNKNFKFTHATGEKENLYFRVFTVMKVSGKELYCKDSKGVLYLLPRKVHKYSRPCK